MINATNRKLQQNTFDTELDKANIHHSLEHAEIKEYLRSLVHFSMLSEEDLEHVAVQTVSQKFSRGKKLATQDATLLSHIYIIRSGGISLHWENDTMRRLVGYIVSDEIFGGISILMNDGISLRTVIVEEETQAYLLPRQVFMEICQAHKNFYWTFIKNFNLNSIDPELDAIINTGIIKLFLSGIKPFSTLSEPEIDLAENVLSLVHYSKGSLPIHAGKSKVSYLYLLQKGSAISYDDQKGQKSVRYKLRESDIFGGVAMLHHDGYSNQSLEVVEDTYFYLLPEKVFLLLCERNPDFRDFFIK